MDKKRLLITLLVSILALASIATGQGFGAQEVLSPYGNMDFSGMRRPTIVSYFNGVIVTTPDQKLTFFGNPWNGAVAVKTSDLEGLEEIRARLPEKPTPEDVSALNEIVLRTSFAEERYASGRGPLSGLNPQLRALEGGVAEGAKVWFEIADPRLRLGGEPVIWESEPDNWLTFKPSY